MSAVVVNSGRMQPVHRMHRLSRMYVPVQTTSKIAPSPSKSATLLIEKGLMRPLQQGTYFYLPMLQRSIDRAVGIVKRFMYKANADEIAIPALTPTRLWEESGRLEPYRNNLYVTEDKAHILGPTFEESITQLLANDDGVPEGCLPLRYFQIGTKFRNEADPKHGLMRTREFIMKDMYTFDVDKSSAMDTYAELNDVYARLFRFIGVPFVKVEADATSMGGSVSQEFHYLSHIGESKLQTCRSCNHSIDHTRNVDTADAVTECPSCKSANVEHKKGIEIGHTFYLGDTYTRRQSAVLKSQRTPLEMGCYGIGVTRLIGAAVESLSTDAHLRWPIPLAPFFVAVVMPEKRSKAFALASHHLDEVHAQLNGLGECNDAILVDDRVKITLGDRVRYAKGLGIPLIVIIGKSASDPDNVKFELHFTYENKTVFLPLNELVAEIRDYMRAKLDENV